jgi:hypothetical protein
MADIRRRAHTHGFRDETPDVESEARRLDLIAGVQERGSFRRRLRALHS